MCSILRNAHHSVRPRALIPRAYAVVARSFARDDSCARLSCARPPCSILQQRPGRNFRAGARNARRRRPHNARAVFPCDSPVHGQCAAPSGLPAPWMARQLHPLGHPQLDHGSQTAPVRRQGPFLPGVNNTQSTSVGTNRPAESPTSAGYRYGLTV